LGIDQPPEYFDYLSETTLGYMLISLRHIASERGISLNEQCPHCGQRNTQWLEGKTWECYDCGQTFESKVAQLELDFDQEKAQ